MLIYIIQFYIFMCYSKHINFNIKTQNHVKKNFKRRLIFIITLLSNAKPNV